MTENNEDPKIIVDDDWKAQVEREKEQLAAAENETPSGSDEMPQGQMPPASFEVLVTSLATQAMAALGFFPDPSTGETMLNRPIAKHFIDTLGVLEEKTSGNLSPQEAELLSQSLHQLRMVFVNSGNESAGGESSPLDDGPKSTIELP